MTPENTTRDPDPPENGGLLDVGDLDLDALAALPDSVLGNAVLRILAQRSALPDRFAAFQNSL
ncbi:FxSxx-COOH cyclophane-containing RiPP peptide [Actinokineospora soli]|uniref:FxSxx-COOH cyclophane-containing RiPP peptide n=1 Tax=Actinokineospora soli TaxID=1048753 RepID=A0ABW2TUX9_9PSEU